jgi:alkylation response protein AidB-like acyl-CoA dehydrogenase
MDLTFSASERSFRDELRQWLTRNGPGVEPRGDELAHWQWRLQWQRRLARGGWAGVDWPRRYGGRGATLTETAIFFEELASAGAPLPADVVGLIHAGPTIMTWGTEAQRQRYLPPLLAGEETWCQGFSEPQAGSDLAALETSATRHADGWLVTGQKVWTTYAQHAKWCILIARTDPDAPKHKGLTYFILDMEQDAIEVRPLRQITGESEFNELFLERAWIPQENVVGGVGEGWKVTLTELMNERAGIGFFLQVSLRNLLAALFDQAAAHGLLGDPLVSDRLGELHMRAEVLRLTALRGLSVIEREGQPGPEGSLTKLMWSETNQQLTQLAAELLGPESLATDSPWSHELLSARANSIEGGTSEILKNILAERILGLPRLR